MTSDDHVETVDRRKLLTAMAGCIAGLSGCSSATGKAETGRWVGPEPEVEATVTGLSDDSILKSADVRLGHTQVIPTNPSPSDDIFAIKGFITFDLEFKDAQDGQIWPNTVVVRGRHHYKGAGVHVTFTLPPSPVPSYSVDKGKAGDAYKLNKKPGEVVERSYEITLMHEGHVVETLDIAFMIKYPNRSEYSKEGVSQ